jgi:hypothetical protein
LVTAELDMLRRIDPEGSEVADIEGVDLEAAWQRAAEDIVAEHNKRADPRAQMERIGAAQRFALDVLRDASAAVPAGADRAAEALSARRNSRVAKELNRVRTRLEEGELTTDQAAVEIVKVVDDFGLQPVPSETPPQPITVDDLGVVCWMGVVE